MEMVPGALRGRDARCVSWEMDFATSPVPQFPHMSSSISKNQSPMTVCEGQVPRQQISFHLGISVRGERCALEREKVAEVGNLRSLRGEAALDSGC